MSDHTSSGRIKARKNKHLYRNPEYLGGLCCVCKKRARNYAHPDYPHMCDKCRSTRHTLNSTAGFQVAPNVYADMQRRSREIELRQRWKTLEENKQTILKTHQLDGENRDNVKRQIINILREQRELENSLSLARTDPQL